MIWIGSVVVNSLLAMRDPVTMIASPVWANAGVAASAVSEAVAARNTLGRVPIFISYPILKLILPPGAPHIRPRAFQYGLRADNPRWRAARLSGQIGRAHV